MQKQTSKEYDISEIHKISEDLNNLVTKEELEKMVELAVQAKERSYSPYSKFRVGCCLISNDGKFYQGTNVENLTYGLTVCSERSAIGVAVVNGSREFKGIVITTDMEYFVTPCGMCRQTLKEFEVKNIILLNTQNKLVLHNLEYLLPSGPRIDHLGK
jgi:cytidine deaminase